MKRFDFNTGWTCRALKSGAEAVPVTLPHDAMRTEARVSTSVGEGNIGWFEGGDYEYRKRFTPEAGLRDKKLLLEFESVYHNAEVWLNGEKLAYRPYGYTNFYVDLTGKLLDGENELTVIARNADQPNSRWYSGTASASAPRTARSWARPTAAPISREITRRPRCRATLARRRLSYKRGAAACCASPSPMASARPRSSCHVSKRVISATAFIN